MDNHGLAALGVVSGEVAEENDLADGDGELNEAHRKIGSIVWKKDKGGSAWRSAGGPPWQGGAAGSCRKPICAPHLWKLRRSGRIMMM